MVDFQLSAVSPDILGVFSFDSSYSMQMYKKFKIPSPNDEDIIKKFFT